MLRPIDSGRAILCLLAAGPLVIGLATSASGSVSATSSRPPEKIYATTCGYCHGSHVAPLIRGRGVPADAVIQIVRTGPAAMPAFRPTEITDAELKSLAQWLQESKADPKETGK